MRSDLIKFCFFITLAFLNVAANAQVPKKLENLSSENYQVKPGYAIIYGNFVPRKQKWMSSGFQQYVWLTDTATKEQFLLEGIRYLKTKEAVFSFYLKAGTYQLTKFIWSASKWYGAYTTTENVYKGIDVTDSLTLKKIKSREINSANVTRFSFTVESGKMYYLGRWDFSTGLAQFTDTKAEADKKMKKDFIWMDFDNAFTVIPK